MGKNLQNDNNWKVFFATRLKNCLLDNNLDPRPSFKVIFSGPRAEFRKIDKRTVGQINYPQIRGRSLIFNNLLHPNLLLLSLHALIERELAKRGILTLHASGIVIGKQALLFCGDPGSGKSTILSYRPKDSVVIGDDKIILKINNDEVLAYSSPFNDKVIAGNIPAEGVLVSGLVFIKKQGSPSCCKIPPSESITLVLNQMLTKPYNNQIRGLLLKTAKALSYKTYLLSYTLGEDVGHILNEIVK